VDLELAAFVCVTSIEALTHTAVLHHAEMLSAAAMETLIDEARPSWPPDSFIC
jgi:hypothetical protein